MSDLSVGVEVVADETPQQMPNDQISISRGEIREIVDAILSTLQGDLTATGVQLFTELASLAKFIDSAKQDIAALRPDEVTDEYIPTASDELDAIVDATAEATNVIMDCAETLEKIAAELDENTGNALIEQTTLIFEACGFQDITGQRITKVVKALQGIDEKVHRLVDAFGHEIERIKASQPEAAGRQTGGGGSDDDLLNGPQLKNQANSQEEIDALLAMFD